jgi:hypothetical protein
LAIPNRLRLALPWRTAVILLAVAAAGPAPRSAGVLDTSVRASWTRLPLREWAGRVSVIAGVPVIVDRRIDHTTPVTLDADGTPLAAVLDQVAALTGAHVEVLASSIRLVPPEAAGLATAGEAAREAELRSLPPATRRSLSAREPLAWPEAEEPRQLLERLVTGANLRLGGLERIPHDHFPAGSLPRLTLAERLDLILAHFDQRVAWTPEGGEVVPLVDRAAAARPGRGDRARPAVGRGKPPADEERHTLRLEAPLDQAVAALARRFSLRPEIDAASLVARGVAPAEIVRVRVESVTRDELFDAVVAPLGLSWAIEDGTLRVFAAPGSTEGDR